MRKTCLDMIYELASQDERIFFVGSDLGYNTLQRFKEEMPDRFLMEGVCEMNVVGLAAGLAMEGNIPYVNTIATFLTRRCYEQIVLDVCHANLPVRLIGNGGGLVYAPLGPTHEATDDLSIMRAIPNMSIVAPADAEEMRRFMPLSVDYPGPIYIRLAKGHDPVVTEPSIPFEIGRAIPMGHGDDALLVTTGIGLRVCLAAASRLAERDIGARILHFPTIKPLDSDTLLTEARKPPVIVSVEEHSVSGGLGSAVAETLVEARFDSPKRFKRIGIPDVFPATYGSQASQMAGFGITPEHVVATIERLTTS